MLSETLTELVQVNTEGKKMPPLLISYMTQSSENYLAKIK